MTPFVYLYSKIKSHEVFWWDICLGNKDKLLKALKKDLDSRFQLHLQEIGVFVLF